MIKWNFGSYEPEVNNENKQTLLDRPRSKAWIVENYRNLLQYTAEFVSSTTCNLSATDSMFNWC